MHSCLEEQLHQLNVLGDRLCHLQMHDAITILRNSFSIPKLLHILRTSPAFSSPLLGSRDQLMMSIVSKITNLDFIQGSTSWLQATLPINSGGLGLWSAFSLAPSAFLASADGASNLMQQLLPVQFSYVPYPDRDCAFSTWKDALPVDTPVPSITSRQKLLDQPTVQHLSDSLLASCTNQTS